MYEETQEQKNEKYMNNVKFISIVLVSFVTGAIGFTLAIFWYYGLI